MEGIHLEKRSRRLEMTESFSWWTPSGASVMAKDRKLSTWTMWSEGETVGWVI